MAPFRGAGARCTATTFFHVTCCIFMSLPLGAIAGDGHYAAIPLEGKCDDALELVQINVDTIGVSSLVQSFNGTLEPPVVGSKADPKANPQAIIGASGNMDNDIHVLMSAFMTDMVIVCFVVTAFCFLRLRLPLVYSGKVLSKEVYMDNATTFFGWLRATWDLGLDDVQAASTLDHALLIQFCRLCMQILAQIGIPMVVVLCPLHAALGGGAAGADRLSSIGFANVTPGSWMCYLHAIVLWGVVGVTMRRIYRAQEEVFLPKRFEWLRSMQEPRATTVLVENIPAEHCTDEALQEYFADIFSPEQVVSAYVVKQTQRLIKLLRELDMTKAMWQVTKKQWERKKEREGLSDEARPTFLNLSQTIVVPRCKSGHRMVPCRRNDYTCDVCGSLGTDYSCEEGCNYDMHKSCYDKVVGQTGEWVDTIYFLEDKIYEMREEVSQERTRILELAKNGNSEVRAQNGFVTFASRRDAVLALQVQYKQDEEKMTTSIPPDPGDVLYSDLQVGREKQKVYTGLGFLAIVGLFFSFVPFVVGISGLTNLHHLQETIPAVRNLCTTFPALAIFLDGILGSLALTVFMDFLPTVMMMIFYNCFQLKSPTWAQHYLQHAYFWFLLLFVVLITAVGASLIETMTKIARTPEVLFQILAGSLPMSTHFYMKYLILQWVSMAGGLCRPAPMVKFMIFRTLYGEEQAKQWCEPEDQDYYGIGARSARFTINMVVALVFCSLSPIITLIGFINFLFAYVFFRYLVVFAETKKTDLGGVFWVTQLEHVQYALLLYVLLMVGVLRERAGEGNWVPPVLAAIPSLAIWFFSFLKFKRALKWQTLPFEEVAAIPQGRTVATIGYGQPEMRAAEEEEKTMKMVRSRWFWLPRIQEPILKPLFRWFGLRRQKP